MRGLALILTLAHLAAEAGAETGAVQLTTRETLRGWEPVGLVEIGDDGYCTGTLIAPDLVLTAASCVISDAGEPIEAGKIRFRAGLIEGVALAESAVLRTIVPDGYESLDPIPFEMIRLDVALLELATPIATAQISPFGLILPVTGGALSIVQYDLRQLEAPTLHQGCRLFGNHDGLVALDCDAGGLPSGAPMLEQSGYRSRVVGIVSAMSQSEGRPVAVGMELPEVVSALKAALARGEATSSVAAPAPEVKTKRITVGTGDDGDTGAKFVTP